MTCEEPDAEALVFSEPRALYPGFLRCKPTFLKNGHQLHFAYDQMSDRYVYQRTEDGGSRLVELPFADDEETAAPKRTACKR